MSKVLDIQGHRGARGLMPENTLPAFARALGIGVTTLELDCAVTRDGVVVVSHDATLNPDITRDAAGAWIKHKDLPVSQFTFDELQRYDVGRIDPACEYAGRFPQQQVVDGTRMPRLADVFALARRAGNEQVRFNIETKISPLYPARTVAPAAFAQALVEVINAHGVAQRALIQSFDWRTLTAVRQIAPQIAPQIATVYLTAEQPFMDNIQRGASATPWNDGLHVSQYGGSVPRMIRAAARAMPDAPGAPGVPRAVWSPCSNDVDEDSVREAHALGLSVVVWTVNTETDMQRMMALGVDGIISDYPDLLRRVAGEQGYALPVPTPVAVC